MARIAERVLWLLTGSLLLVLPVVPVPALVGGPDPGPEWASQLSAWSVGLVTVIVIGVLTGRLTRTVRWPTVRWSSRFDWYAVSFLAVLSLAAALFVQQTAQAGSPQSIDEMAQLFQARLFLAGKLSAPVPSHPEFFLFPHTWITEAGWVQQFPPGHPVLLAVGMAAGAEWLVNPVLGAVSTVLVFLLARGWYGRRTALVATLLWTASGWTLFMNASFQNHVTSVACGLGAWVAIWGTRRPRMGHFILCGVLVAWVAVTRPLDAVVVALPLAVWMVAKQKWTMSVAAGLAGTPILIGWFVLNAKLYGSPTTTGYALLYGAEHQLGFHTDVYGVDYTPLVALSNMTAALRRIHIYLFEWPIPAALIVGAWALVARHRHPADRYLAMIILGAPVLYFFYWHSGFYPGPRFYYPAAAGLVIGTARAGLWAWKRLKRFPSGFVRWEVAGMGTAVAVLVWGAVAVLPLRYQSERSARPSLKERPDLLLAERNVSEALVLVPESWGSRVIVDLWSVGVLPGVVERGFRFLDTCDLQEMVEEARQGDTDATALTRRIDSMARAADAPPPPLEGWKDVTIRRRPDRRQLSPVCQRELRRDLAGYALYSHLGWRNDIGLMSGVVFARDLYDRNDALVAEYPGWLIWRFAPPPGQPDALPVLTPVRPIEGEDAP